MKKISLLSAILININIVVGAGFFLSAPGLIKASGLLAPFTWILVGLLILPLTLLLAKFSKSYPEAGGIFVYSDKTLGSFWGFVSGWTYFIGTAACNAAMLLNFGKQLQIFGFSIPILNGLALNLVLTFIFMGLSFFNIKLLEKFQVGITILKTIPIFLVIVAAFFLFSKTNISTAPINFSGMLQGIPFALFSYIGIEACTSITHTIKDGHKNAARAMIFSLLLIITIYTVVQFLLLSIHGIHSSAPFIDILPKLTSNPFIIMYGTKIINFAILSSFLGGFYGMFYANNWILYAIAKQNSIFGSKKLSKINKYHAPWASVIVQGLLLIAFFLITMSTKNLIIMGDFGVVIPYILTTVSFIVFAKIQKINKTVGFFALLGCLALLVVCFQDLVELGIKCSIPFILILCVGLFAYWFNPASSIIKKL